MPACAKRALCDTKGMKLFGYAGRLFRRLVETSVARHLRPRCLPSGVFLLFKHVTHPRHYRFDAASADSQTDGNTVAVSKNRATQRAGNSSMALA